MSGEGPPSPAVWGEGGGGVGWPPSHVVWAVVWWWSGAVPRLLGVCVGKGGLTSRLVERHTGVSAPRAGSAERTDDELISGWRRGDELAAAELVRRHTPAVARFLAASGARDDLDDLVQETFIKAFRRIDTYRGQAAFRTWLLAIGANLLKDTYRRRRRRDVLRIEDREFEDPGADPHGDAVESDLLRALGAAVQRLTPLQRDVFLMRAQQGAEYREIARVLDTTEGAARVHYHHAVRRLKEELK